MTKATDSTETTPADARAALAHHMSGGAAVAFARDIGAARKTVQRLLERSHAPTIFDVRSDNLDPRHKIRDCITCGWPIYSQHAGVRLCAHCSERLGGEIA